MNPGQPGVYLYLNSGQTSPVTINSTDGTATMRVAGVTINAGAGAFTLGNASLSTTTNVTLGDATAGDPVYWINNSSSGASVGANVFFSNSSTAAHVLVFGGSGNWQVNANPNSHNGGAITVSQSGAGV